MELSGWWAGIFFQLIFENVTAASWRTAAGIASYWGPRKLYKNALKNQWNKFKLATGHEWKTEQNGGLTAPRRQTGRGEKKGYTRWVEARGRRILVMWRMAATMTLIATGQTQVQLVSLLSAIFAVHTKRHPANWPKPVRSWVAGIDKMEGKGAYTAR